ncbi:MarR family winged helix-turn-helix transcriptional regulator [Streptomyces sp. NPDC001571]|uniref:MarR family winged helix-turn-helix transcriptional regulator n=1 Tax=unclassified Streptomyces TaxID=2593676 RepID=UPI000C278394|nr:MarR family winged helix-turn-helix transcriptional regulator [Streptomyces sp. CB01201]MBX7467224.1 MarR family winged helix-turn-helix transcriptional regulator [Streptomyces sp. MAG02]PJN05136.1 MarR family transcriptional regulator [Streptomyces sp. CB01201]
MEYKSPDDASELHGFFSDLVRCETRLYNALNDHLRRQHGIVTSQFEFLRFLREHPGSRVADLAAEFAIGVGATSKGVDRLENRGWIVRQANPADRRSSLLALSGEGSRLLTAAEETFTATLRGLLGGALDASGTAAAGRSLSRLRVALEREQIGTPAG